MAERRPGTGPAVTGHVDLVHPTAYVKAADLKGRDVTVEIVKVTWEDLVMAGGVRSRKPALHMRSTKGKPVEKLWIVGKTVCKQIAASVNEREVQNWTGKRVTMYPTTCRGQRGEEVECIRVRVRVNARADEIPDDMAAAPAPAPAVFDDEDEAPAA